MNPVRIVGFAGSLRDRSLNRILLEIVGERVSREARFESIDLFDIPLYNADVEEQGEPDAVVALRSAVREADGVLIATPEYSHGTSGVLKNTLDWLARGDKPRALEGKPVGIMGASPGRFGTRRAQADVRQTLAVLGAYTMVRPWLMVYEAKTRLSADGTRDEALERRLAAFTSSFLSWVERIGAGA